MFYTGDVRNLWFTYAFWKKLSSLQKHVERPKRVIGNGNTRVKVYGGEQGWRKHRV